MSGLGLAAIGFALLASALFLWFRLMNDVTLGRHRAKLFALIAAGMLCAAAALGVSPGIVGTVLAGVTLLGGGLWFALRALAPQSLQPAAVAVGAPMLDFHAPDETGAEFELSSLRGHPVLIKLFRGHW